MAEKTLKQMVKSGANSYPEINDIREDLNTLQTDAVRLGRRVAADGKEKLQDMAQNAQEQLSTLKDQGSKQMEYLEGRIRTKPVQSIAIAFGAGLLASLLLGRR